LPENLIRNPEKKNPSQDMSITNPGKKNPISGHADLEPRKNKTISGHVYQETRKNTSFSGHVHLLIHVSLYKSSGLKALVCAQQLQRNLIRNPEKKPHLRTCPPGTQKRKTHLRTWQSGTQEKKTHPSQDM
jgi:hypothetical protein